MPTVTVIEPTIQEQTGTKIRVAAYCRVSSSSDDQLNSYAAQVTYYSNKFENSDTEVLTDLYADEGITGTCDTKRMEFQRMIANCRRGKIDRIYTKSISRFARNTRDCLKYVRELKELGITIFFEKENIDTANVTDEMMITIMGGLAQEESVSISNNLKWSYKRRMQAGRYITNSAPFGYVLKNGMLQVNESEAIVIREIFDYFINGHGAFQTAEYINHRYPDMRKWDTSAIQYVLSNEKYIGDSELQKTYTPDTIGSHSKRNNGILERYYVEHTHEPIVSREIFEAAQQAIAFRRITGKPRQEHIFTKKIVCGNCGKHYRRKECRGTVYWVCVIHDIKAEYCESARIPEENIIEAFIRLHNKLLKNYQSILLPLQASLQELHAKRFASNPRIMDIYKEIAKLREQVHVLTKLRTKGFLSEAKYQEQTAEHNRKIHRLQKELQKISRVEDENDLLEQIDILIETFEKREHLMVSFEPETFDTLVNKIIASGQDKLEFQLIGGMNLTENIYVL